MPASKTERLVNLVICLLASRTFVTKERLRTTLEPYRNCPTDEAFERMFERDKEELRELGIPLEVGTVSALFEDEVGYRIAPGEYALPELHLEPDEAAAIGIAARFWQQATLAQAASSALLKLKAAGLDVGEAAPAGIEPRVRAEAPAFEPLLEAVYDRQVVRFSYRRSDGEVRAREVEPWTIDSWRGRWYLAGYDLGRDDARVFRLDRITSPVLLTGRAPQHKVPDRLDVRAQVDAFAVRSSGDLGPATLRVREGTCFPLRRGAGSVVEGEDGWDTIVITAYADTAGWLAEYGPDVVVLDPPSLRAAVIARLRAIARPEATSAGAAVAGPIPPARHAGPAERRKPLEVAS
ncbi:WYL domain-containing protein [Actinocrinis puniceicyclus]|uniref:WYL domain-containing protein n=1 Tax=Actinocrinis puniceicyclus TaxID=977794 RepID=A0A8J7WKT2_9ACTN|nr:WYL domain-containing protein [Actinocrinis puniceicyclus]MBS2961634.1 WYL domain-containing protein [Actinocrinis puniceicyclus]